MKKRHQKIIYIPETNQRILEQLVQDIIVKDAMARDMLVAYLVTSYNELRKVEPQQAEKIIQIDGR